MNMSNKYCQLAESESRHVRLKYMVIISFFMAMLCSNSIPAAAAYRQHDSHEHGAAVLNVALEGEELAIELVSPAANIVGFEHEPATEKEQQAVSEARRQLMEGGELFKFPESAECILERAEVNSDFDSPAHEEHAEEPVHEHEKGKQQADSADHESHGDFRAEYHFHVGRPRALTFLETLLMQRFPAIDHLEVRLVTPSAQTTVELPPGSVRVELPK